MEMKFEKLFQFSSGKAVSVLSEGKYPVFGSNGVVGYSRTFKYKNKLIVGRVGAHCGSVEYCNKEFNATDNALIVTCNEEVIRYYYAYYLLKIYNLNSFAGGAAQPLITQNLLKKLKCFVPTIKEQDEIVGYLLSFDNLIKNNIKRIKLLEQMAENLYKEWFVRFRFPNYSDCKFVKNVPESWREGQLSDLCNFVRGKNITNEQMVSGEYEVVSAGLEPSGYHNKANVKGVSVTISASGANAGYVSFHQRDIWAADCSYISSQNAKNIYYLYGLINSLRPIITNLQIGSAQPHVYPKQLNKIKILIPPTPLIELGNKKLGVIYKQIEIFTQQNQNLIKQRDMLLPRLMSGKLQVK